MSMTDAIVIRLTGDSGDDDQLIGRHGEAPMPVLAAKTASDCFYTCL
jgi:hypothetical protein